MTRNMSGTRLASKKSPANGNAGVPAFADALEFNLDFARNMLSSSLATLQGCLECVEQVQQVNAETVKDFSSVVTTAAEKAQHATTLSELLEVHRALTTGQFMRAAQSYGALFARLSSVEGRLIQEAQSAAAARSRTLLNGIGSQWRRTGTAAQ